MKKYITFLTAAFTLAAGSIKAQMPYRYSVKNQAYAPLTGATSVNGLTAWADSNNYMIPIGFNFKMGGKTITKISLVEMNSVATDTTGTVSGMSFIGTSLIDRGLITGTSKSPVRYTTTGNAGSRIFKLEIFNAGFYDENDLYSTLDDSLNLQIWLYEDSNAVELRYGPSKISHYSDYFFMGGPLVGYLKDMNRTTMNYDKLYLLKGNPATPTLDSVSGITTTLPTLNAFPQSGTVYRFVPKTSPTAIKNTEGNFNLKVYPTLCTDRLFIENNVTEPILYKVISTTGVTVISGNLSSGKNELDISHLPAGMFVLVINNGSDTDIYKFIKQ